MPMRKLDMQRYFVCITFGKTANLFFWIWERLVIVISFLQVPLMLYRQWNQRLGAKFLTGSIQKFRRSCKQRRTPRWPSRRRPNQRPKITESVFLPCNVDPNGDLRIVSNGRKNMESDSNILSIIPFRDCIEENQFHWFLDVWIVYLKLQTSVSLLMGSMEVHFLKLFKVGDFRNA